MTSHPKLQNKLAWFPELDLGFYPVSPQDYPYDQGYWDKYAVYANQPMGKAITAARVEFVEKFYKGPLTDVGIGCGDFIETRNKKFGTITTGCDINPVGIEWLHSRELWKSPFEESVQAASFWDVIEHIPDHAELLSNIEDFFFISVPIFTGPEDVLASKHFRRDEHYWYWTDKSIGPFFAQYGFELIGKETFEMDLGRESIGTYAFQRVNHASRR